eukprot:SAG11_NODE_446_length_9395_cov_19.399957_8_plen_88_part_00
MTGLALRGWAAASARTAARRWRNGVEVELAVTSAARANEEIEALRERLKECGREAEAAARSNTALKTVSYYWSPSVKWVDCAVAVSV